MAKILIADDSSFMRKALRNILIKMGHTVIEARNGEDVLKIYQEEHPDLVSLDINMPVMDGLTCLIRLQEEHPEAKTIICSSMGQQAIVVDAIKHGARDFIVKPFNAAQVMVSVKRALM